MSGTTFTLTDEQSAVVWSAENALIVRAAAGSGKTRVLVSRYLKHVVEDGIAPDRILTVTFTKKAAAEMKRRIVDALVQASLPEAAQIAETGPIQTLHGFCDRLLRENAIAAGVDPDFEILDEATAARWLDEATKAAIEESGANFPYAERLIETLAGKRAHNKSSAHGALESAIADALKLLRGTLYDVDEIAARHADPQVLTRAWREAIVAEAPVAVRDLFEALPSKAPFWPQLRDQYKAAKATAPKWVSAAASDGDALDAACAEATCGLIDIVCRIWRRFEDRMRQEQRFDFAFLESEAVRLAHVDSIGDRVRAQYRVLLVDESQDLNPVQYRLLTTLGIEVEMSVGDAQQSIYSFRQADVNLFVERTQKTPTLSLPRNFRSEAPILNVVDRLFGRIWPGDYIPMAPSTGASPKFDGVELWKLDTMDSSQVAAWIAEFAEGEDPSGIAVLTKTNATASKLHAKLELLGVPARVVGGGETFYARMEIRDTANALSALVDPSDDLALLAVLRGPIVELSLDSIVLLASSAPVAQAIPSFEAPNDDDKAKLEAFWAWFDPLSKYADRLSAWEAITEIWMRSPFMANLATRPNSAQTLANVRKLLTLAGSRPELNARDFAEVIRHIQQLEHREGDAPFVDEDEKAITLMTIHKSKGLEYDCVVLPDLFFGVAGNARPVEAHKGLGLVAFKVGPGLAPARDWIADQRKAVENAESLRQLYVAMTRAKRRLAMVVSPKDQRKLAGRIWTTLDPDNDPLAGCKVLDRD